MAFGTTGDGDSMTTVARVLVTEDDHAVRAVILRVLGQHGYEVIEACQMAEALDKWHATRGALPIDLLITDHMMPGGTGRDLANELWLLQPDLPVLFMSGYQDEDLVVEPSARVVHLSKPFTSAQLLGHVEHLLRLVRPRPESGAP
jgi:CheY-like chemotaxis protein